MCRVPCAVCLGRRTPWPCAQADEWQSHWNDTFSVGASGSDDTKTLQIRVVNNNTHAISVAINLARSGRLLPAAELAATVFSAQVLRAPNGGLNQSNTPASPDLVAPVAAPITGAVLQLPAHAFAVVVVTLP